MLRGIDRLGIAAYNWWNGSLHGVARAGTAAVFSQAIALAAAWNEDLMFEVGETVADEARAKYNASVRHGDRDIYAYASGDKKDLQLSEGQQRLMKAVLDAGNTVIWLIILGIGFILALDLWISGVGRMAELHTTQKIFSVLEENAEIQEEK